MSFPKVKMTKKFNKNANEFINFVKVSLFGLFHLYVDDFSEFNSGLAFNGFYEFENNLYVFLCIYSIMYIYFPFQNNIERKIMVYKKICYWYIIIVYI